MQQYWELEPVRQDFALLWQRTQVAHACLVAWPQPTFKQTIVPGFQFEILMQFNIPRYDGYQMTPGEETIG